MSGGLLAQALDYLIGAVLGLFIIAVALRFLLQLAGADFYNPASQLLVKLTNPALRPLRRLAPPAVRQFAGIDWPSVALLLLLKMLDLGLTLLLLGRPLWSPAGLMVLALAELIRLFIYIYIVVILILAISSWVAPAAYNPITVLLYQLSEPLLRRIRRHIPPVSGFDFSTLAALILLPLLFYLLVEPLVMLARSL